MAGVKNLRKIQLGREGATPGAPVAATTIWRGIGTIDDQREIKFVEEQIGILPGTDRTYTAKLAGAIDFESIEASFEQSPHVFEASIKSVGTGVADGAGTGMIYEYPFPVLAVPDIETYTIEGGDNQEAERMEFAFVDGFELSGKGGEAWFIVANWLGRQVAVNAFTGALTVPTVEEIMFGKTRLYIDAAGGTIGTTLISNSLLEAKLSYKSGLIPRYSTGEALFFSHLKKVDPEALLELTFEFDGNATAERVNYRAQTPRLIRLISEGSNLATAGTDYSKKTMIIDLAGKWERFDKIGEQDGADVITGHFRGRYNSTAALFGKVLVVNELTAIP